VVGDRRGDECSELVKDSVEREVLVLVLVLNSYIFINVMINGFAKLKRKPYENN
jgi:hypothetical protein